MKAFELLSLYKTFKAMVESPDFNEGEKVGIARELLLSLPAEQLCTATPNTYDAIRNRIAAYSDQKTESSQQGADGQELQQPAKPRTKPVRKAEAKP